LRLTEPTYQLSLELAKPALDDDDWALPTLLELVAAGALKPTNPLTPAQADELIRADITEDG